MAKPKLGLGGSQASQALHQGVEMQTYTLNEMMGREVRMHSIHKHDSIKGSLWLFRFSV